MKNWKFLLLMSIWMACAVVLAAEPDKRPQIWIYTDPDHCVPCKRLDQDIEAGKLDKFRIKKLASPKDTIRPCIYWKDSHGKWRHREGWGSNDPAGFLDEYKQSMTDK
jgi:hypothetical protein